MNDFLLRLLILLAFVLNLVFRPILRLLIVVGRGHGMGRVFITGSSTGLGLMAGQLLVEQGHEVVLHARNEARARDACAGLGRNVPVVIGGVVISPGDVICADDDGVVAVPRDEAEWALEQARARTANEDTSRAKLAAGELGVDFYGLRATLAELGVEYVDSLEE